LLARLVRGGLGDAIAEGLPSLIPPVEGDRFRGWGLNDSTTINRLVYGIDFERLRWSHEVGHMKWVT
jgi:hypothetical protein